VSVIPSETRQRYRRRCRALLKPAAQFHPRRAYGRFRSPRAPRRARTAPSAARGRRRQKREGKQEVSNIAAAASAAMAKGESVFIFNRPSRSLHRPERPGGGAPAGGSGSASHAPLPLPGTTLRLEPAEEGPPLRGGKAQASERGVLGVADEEAVTGSGRLHALA